MSLSGAQRQNERGNSLDEEDVTKKDPPTPRILRFREENSVAIAIIDREMQERFPRLLVSSTLLTQANSKKALREFRDSEPKLVHDK